MSEVSSGSSGEVVPAGPAIDSLPPRAVLAMLTLRLRNAELQADREEAAAALGEHDALGELRARLASMIRERNRAHVVALDEARARAAAEVESARSAAAATLAQLSRAAEISGASSSPAEGDADTVADFPPAETRRAALQEVDATSSVSTVRGSLSSEGVMAEVGPSAGVEQTGQRSRSGHADHPSLAKETLVSGRSGSENLTGHPGATQVVIDAEVLGRVLGSVFSSMLDERLAAWVKATAGPQMLTPAAPTVRPKSVFSYLRHPDVALLAVATVIVLGVLVAWMG